jgi:hypothetical protein
MGTHSQDEVAQMIKVKDSEIFAMVRHWFFLWLVYWVAEKC